jgi:UMF1 family MFS transporter
MKRIWSKVLSKLALDRPEARAWAMYDWANSAFMLTVITTLFPVYFVSVLVDGQLEDAEAQQRFAETTRNALIMIAILAPILGTVADLRAAKKLLLAVFAGIGVVATAVMFFLYPGDWRLALWLFGIANIGAAGSVVFYDALLPHVAKKGEMDRLSTAGFALGYLGSGLLLILNLLWVQKPEWFGLPHGEGLTAAEKTLPVRLSFLSVAVWWAVFTLPILRRVKEPARTLEPDEFVGQSTLRVSFQRLKETFQELRGFKQAFLMLIAFLVYNDGIATIIRMAAIYAASRDLDFTIIIGSILVIQFVGVPFAFLFGQLGHHFGAKRMVLGGIAVYAFISVLAYFMTENWHFVLLAVLVGMVQGGTQGLSRSLFASMIPTYKSGEFFAFFAVGEKFAGILGPALFAGVIALTGDSQNAILSIIVFFVIGGVILTRVDVEEGRRKVAELDAQVRVET